MENSYLALKEDIDDAKEAPTVITLNDMVLTVLNVMAPTGDQFIERRHVVQTGQSGYHDGCGSTNMPNSSSSCMHMMH